MAPVVLCDGAASIEGTGEVGFALHAASREAVIQALNKKTQKNSS